MNHSVFRVFFFFFYQQSYGCVDEKFDKTETKKKTGMGVIVLQSDNQHSNGATKGQRITKSQSPWKTRILLNLLPLLSRLCQSAHEPF